MSCRPVIFGLLLVLIWSAGCGYEEVTFETLLATTEADPEVSEQDREVILEKIVEWTETGFFPKKEIEEDWGRYNAPTLTYSSSSDTYDLFFDPKRSKFPGDHFSFEIDGKDMSIMYMGGL